MGRRARATNRPWAGVFHRGEVITYRPSVRLFDMPPDLPQLRRIARDIRRQVLELSYSSKSGHIGSSLSCVDLLVALYFRFLNVVPGRPLAKDRDRFLMSKGHACVPFYACLERLGFIPSDVL